MTGPAHRGTLSEKQHLFLKALYRGAGLPPSKPCCGMHASREIDTLLSDGVKPSWPKRSPQSMRFQQKRSHNQRARKARR